MELKSLLYVFLITVYGLVSYCLGLKIDNKKRLVFKQEIERKENFRQAELKSLNSTINNLIKALGKSRKELELSQDNCRILQTEVKTKDEIIFAYDAVRSPVINGSILRLKSEVKILTAQLINSKQREINHT